MRLLEQERDAAGVVVGGNELGKFHRIDWETLRAQIREALLNFIAQTMAPCSRECEKNSNDDRGGHCPAERTKSPRFGLATTFTFFATAFFAG
jgi:hypothetical protein